MSAPAMKPAPSNFTLAVSLFITATIFLGFSFTIYPDVLARARPALLYLHVVTAPAWLLLLVAQVVLVRKGMVARHRAIGVYGLWLGAVASVTSFFTALILRHDSVIRHGPNDQMIERIAFLSIPLNGFVVFTVALALAAYWRRRPAFHRRAMMLAAVSLMGAGLARLPVPDAYSDLLNYVPDAVLLVLCAHDYWTTRRVHPVYLAGVPLFVAMELGAQYLSNQHPAWWVATARALIGV
jgi:uncharacterized membrane protein YozB (DUF420 family)